MNAKLEKLSQMLKNHYCTWVELFKDEETGQEEPIERQELIEMELTDEECQIIKENAILHGEENNSLSQLTAYCNAERLEGSGSSRRIGF